MDINFTTKRNLKIVFRLVTASVLLASLSINSTGQQRVQQYTPVQIDQRVLEQQRRQQVEQHRMQQQLEQQRRQQVEQQRRQQQLEQQGLQKMQPQHKGPSALPQVNQGALETLRRRPPPYSAPDPDYRGQIDSMPEYPPVPEPSENLGQQPRPSRPHSGCTRP